ncbi:MULTISPECIES: hypothetical protein [Lelliottia]|uniref:hypothetical protein n=1 Tax=Lelliottia TaxID=1330545 RepID=UPI00074401F4|nr:MULTISPECIES: hypothetical protein [Lelliottia]ATG01048.1 hypothetical protein CO697_05320 [Lelliottia amnigena]MBL5964766.1 hypothetical protein [Lelliottia amnigena]MEA9397241.1 hypothetical protein [Lelliottia amnigena]QXA21347.1 hypothetical protein I6L74_18360 [Lelliottia amnigena]
MSSSILSRGYCITIQQEGDEDDNRIVVIVAMIKTHSSPNTQLPEDIVKRVLRWVNVLFASERDD